MDKTLKIEISFKTIVLTVLFLLFLKFLWIIHELIFSLLIAFIIVSALKPLVVFLENKKIPRLIAAFLVYLLFLFFISNILWLIFPPLIKESGHFLKTMPFLINKFLPTFSSFFNFESFVQYVPDITDQLFSLVKNIFSNALFIVTTLFFGFYLLLEEKAVERFFSRFLDEKKAKKLEMIVQKAEKRMNAWFWGELVLMTTVGTVTFVGLNLIGIKYSLSLAVLAGFLEVVPNLGPIISMIPAVLLGLSQSYFLGFAAIALYFLVQQLENNLIVPLVMKKAVGLSPLVTLIALIIGGKLAGVLGVLLAIPFTLILDTILTEIITKKQSVN